MLPVHLQLPFLNQDACSWSSRATRRALSMWQRGLAARQTALKPALEEEAPSSWHQAPERPFPCYHGTPPHPPPPPIIAVFLWHHPRLYGCLGFRIISHHQSWGHLHPMLNSSWWLSLRWYVSSSLGLEAPCSKIPLFAARWHSQALAVRSSLQECDLQILPKPCLRPYYLQGQGHTGDSDISRCCSAPLQTWLLSGVGRSQQSSNVALCILWTTQPCMAFLLSSMERQGLQSVFRCRWDVKGGFSCVVPKNFSVCWALLSLLDLPTASVSHVHQRCT